MAVKHQMKLWVVALAAALSYGILFIILSQQPSKPVNNVENQEAQALAPVYFEDGNGKRVTLDDFRGQPVIVNLWATWCAPCVAELPALDKLQAKLRKQGLAVIPISMDRGEDIRPVAAFLKKHKIEQLKPYWDKDRQIPENWKYDGIPVSFLISRDGRLMKKVEGAYAWDKGAMLKTAQELVK